MSEDFRVELAKPLDRARVSQRQGAGGKTLDYIETHDAIRTANRIFGFGNWGHVIDELVCLGEEPFTNRQNKEGIRVGYRCTVRLSVKDCVPVSGIGYGDAAEYGGSRITPHELAAKEAESDALKRALKNYGDQFGLLLYAKTEAERSAIELAAQPLASFQDHERIGLLLEALSEADPSKTWPEVAEKAAKRDYGHGVRELTVPQAQELAGKLQGFLDKQKAAA